MCVCLYVLCSHLLEKGWPLGSRLWCLLWVCHFPIGILGQVWYLIVSIPELCTLTYFYLSTKYSCQLLCIILTTDSQNLGRLNRRLSEVLLALENREQQCLKWACTIWHSLIKVLLDFTKKCKQLRLRAIFYIPGFTRWLCMLAWRLATDLLFLISKTIALLSCQPRVTVTLYFVYI